jgi:hypothetical protein
MFIIAMGRSGSTLLHEVLSRHPRAAFLIDPANRHPEQPVRTRALLRAMDLPLVGPRIAIRTWPDECWPFWEHQCPGFSVPGRDLLASDATAELKQRVAGAMAARTTRRRSRLLLKITGWPRIRFLAEVFPTARFVHLVRDGRAVAASQIERPWWTGRRGPEHWAWGPLPPAYREQWERSDGSQMVLSAIAWEMVLDAIEECKQEVEPSRLMEMRYEDLCRDPRRRLEQITDFFELAWVPGLDAELRRRPIDDRNLTRRDAIDSPSWSALGSTFTQHLARYGYT